MSAGRPNDSSGYPEIIDLTKGEGGAAAAPPSATQNYYMGDSDDDGSASGSRRYGEPGTPGKVVESGRENTGRWTGEEHAAFLSALKQYGKEWKKVAAKVKTRTVMQTRTHAQKYFQKLQKAKNDGSDGKLESVDMETRKSGSAHKKRRLVKPPPQRSQSTVSTHVAASHLMSHLSGGKKPMLGFPTSGRSFATPAGTFAAHGLLSGAGPSANDQPLLPPQAYLQSGLFNRGFQGPGNKPMSIVAPDPDIHNRMGKFPEPSQAACGKRKLAEIVAAQMPAGVMGDAKPYSEATKPPALKLPGPGDVTSPGEPPKLPLSRSSTPPKQSGFSLQIVNPETLGVTYEKTTKKKRTHSDSSPTTPWDGQLKALVSETQRMSDEKKPKEKEDEESEDAKTPEEVELGSFGFPHLVCGPATGFGKSSLHKAVCEMNVEDVKNQLTAEPNKLPLSGSSTPPKQSGFSLQIVNPETLHTGTMPLHQPNTFPSIGTKVYLDTPIEMRDTTLTNERTQQSLSKCSRDAAQYCDTTINDCPPHSLWPLQTLENEVLEEDAYQELFAILTCAIKKYPKFTAEDLRREMEAMTEQERTATLSDIFGNMCSLGARLKRPEPGLVNPLIVKMGHEIDQLPKESKPALMEAMTKSPHEFASQRLQLFLQCENMNYKKAASRLVRYWEERRRLFGSDKFCLPMNLDGAMCDDRVALEAGFMHQLPGVDASGRQIVWSALSRDTRKGYDGMSTARVCWYVNELISRNPNADNGCVFLADVGDMTLWEFFPDLDEWYVQTMLNALPITVVSLHVCNLEDYIGRTIIPIWLAFMDKMLRSRTIVHNKSTEDALSPFGILSDDLPSEMGGSLSYDDISHSEWGQFLSI